MADKYYTPSNGKYIQTGNPNYVNLHLVTKGCDDFEPIGIVKTWRALLQIHEFRKELNVVIYKGLNIQGAIMPNKHNFVKAIYRKWDLKLKAQKVKEKPGPKTGHKKITKA
jgi:hypothetical protein